MKEIVIIGGGGHAKVLISVIKKIKDFSILGYTDIRDNGYILGVKRLGDNSILEKLKLERPKILAAIGKGSINIASNQKRAELFKYTDYLGIEMPAIISPDAVVNEDVEIGSATVVLDGAIINSGSRLGTGVIVNTKASIDHDCNIGDFVHIAPGVTLSGGVKISDCSFVGAGATIIQYKKIGRECLVGAGAVVVSDCDEYGCYLGVPAKKQE